MISDQDDAEEIDFLQKLFIGYVLTEIFVKVLLMGFGLNNHRKIAYLIGHIGTCLSWIAIGICYFFDNYAIPKIFGFSFLTWVGPFMMNTYYSILGEVCNPEAIGISNFTFTGLGALIVFVTPYIVSDQSKFGWFCMTIGVIGLLFSALSFCFVMETRALDKIEIHRKLSVRRDAFKLFAKGFARRASSIFSRSSSVSSKSNKTNLADSLKRLANKRKDSQVKDIDEDKQENIGMKESNNDMVGSFGMMSNYGDQNMNNPGQVTGKKFEKNSRILKKMNMKLSQFSMKGNGDSDLSKKLEVKSDDESKVFDPNTDNSPEQSNKSRIQSQSEVNDINIKPMGSSFSDFDQKSCEMKSNKDPADNQNSNSRKLEIINDHPNSVNYDKTSEKSL